MQRPIIVFFVLTLVGAACSSDDSSGTAATGSAGAETQLTVFAASSLTAVLQDAIGPDFEAQHDGLTITFNFGASDGLAGQIQSEGTADVFASASGTWMDAVQDDPGVTDRSDFATNRLVIITPPDNPANIASIDDLANAGRAARARGRGRAGRATTRARRSRTPASSTEAEANVVSNEEDNASVVAKVTAGEADAAIVYTLRRLVGRRERRDGRRDPRGRQRASRRTRSRSSPVRPTPTLAGEFVNYVLGRRRPGDALRSTASAPPG